MGARARPLHGLPGPDGRLGGRDRVHRCEGRLGSLADLSRRVAPGRAHRAAVRRRRPAARSDLVHPVPTDRNVGRRGVARPRDPQPVGHPGVRPLPADARAVHVGDGDVRRLHDVRPSAAAECDRARRHRARREHGLHVSQPAHAARAVQPGRALPAHPLPRLRRGVRMAAASHRRPVGRVGAVPARRLGVHRRGRRRVALPHQHRVVVAARRGGPWGGRPAHRVGPRLPALPADGRREPPARCPVREHRPDQRSMDNGPVGGVLGPVQRNRRTTTSTGGRRSTTSST